MWDIWKGLKRTAHDLEVVNFMALAGPLALWGEGPQGFKCLPKVSGATGSGLQGLARSFAFSSGSFKVVLFVSTEQVTMRQLGGNEHVAQPSRPQTTRGNVRISRCGFGRLPRAWNPGDGWGWQPLFFDHSRPWNLIG